MFRFVLLNYQYSRIYCIPITNIYIQIQSNLTYTVLFSWIHFLFGFSFCLNQNNFRYVDTHWIPLRVSTTNNQTGQIISNVTGVFGGWIFIDRFPMPPAHGRLTNVRQSFVFDLLSINIISSTLICLTFKLTDMFVLVVMSSLSLISHLSSLSLSLISLSLFPLHTGTSRPINFF